MTLPASIDDFFKARSSKKRTRLRSLLKRLEKTYSGNVTIKIISEKRQVEQLCRDAEEISKKTYQYAKSEGFVDNAETRQLLTVLAERGWLRAYFLYIEDRPCAFWAGFVYKNTFYGIPVGGTGFDPKYQKYEVGTILMLKMIEDLCNDTHVKYIDFGYMDSAYKRCFCDLNWKEANFNIFSPSLKGIMLNTARVLLGASRQITHLVLIRLKLKEKWTKFKHERFGPKLV